MAITENENIPLSTEIETRQAVQMQAGRDAARLQDKIDQDVVKRNTEEVKKRDAEKKKRSSGRQSDELKKQEENKPGVSTRPQAPEKARQEATIRQANRISDQRPNRK